MMHENLAMPVGRIGKVLLEAGKITEANALEIVQHQSNTGLRFGDAALALNFITEQDLQDALSSQFDFQYLKEKKSLSEKLVAAYDPYCAQTEAFRALRTQLLLRWFDGSSNLLAFVAADVESEGAVTAANFAIVCSQIGKKTLLIDTDLTHSPLSALFGVNNANGLSNCLIQRSTIADASIKVEGLDHLSVLFAGSQPPNPQELLSKSVFPELLSSAAKHYDIVVINSPTIEDKIDAHLIATRSKGVVLVAKKNISMAKKVKSFKEMTAVAGVHMVGAVLNE